MGFESLTGLQLLALFTPHFILQLSGLVFGIPRKRHPDGNRIWPQYRYEALVRCLALMAIAWHRKNLNNKKKNEFSVIPSALILYRYATMTSADAVTNWYQKKGENSRTIRDLKGPPGALYLMSSAQFHAKVHCLLTADRLCVQLAALTVVQTTAFSSTLRRKAIISQAFGLVVYGMVLIMGMAVILTDLLDRQIFGTAVTVANLAALVRFECRINRYVLWGIIALVLGTDESTRIMEGNPVLPLGSSLLLLGGALKRQMEHTSIKEGKRLV
ncbi:unknown protein [Seminavis robusta]|uniref:Uncharacterized protein n=1 Tax=Seminavis robusta TaxID=568900 RepID=A0A9N8ER33_9STRA|nr:unknown protein [Seminavis robusta]|eukprot:Sro1433_g272190.1 n/a (272) ;mRNA; r:4753-5568